MTVDLVANPGKATYVSGGVTSRNSRHAPRIEPEPKVTWRTQANCQDVEDPEIFFPDPSDLISHKKIIEEYCDGCPVKAECLADDLATPGPRWGIRGGQSAEDRTPQTSTPGSRPLLEVCRQGHPYSEANTTSDRRGHRRCIACLRQDRQNRKARRRAES